MKHKGVRLWLCAGLALCLPALSVLAGPPSAADIRSRIENADPSQPLDLANADLSGLDLSGLDLSGADLAGANLSHARLADTRLTNANLAGARLDGAWLIGADFTGANLRGAHMFGPVVAKGLQTSQAQSPVFAGADFTGARVIAKLSNGNAANAVFAHAKLAADMANQSMGLMRLEAENADLAGADFRDADLGHALFRFANLAGADFRGADIRAAEFDGANLCRARFAGADARGASFTDAQLDGATGIDQAKGMAVDNAR